MLAYENVSSATAITVAVIGAFALNLQFLIKWGADLRARRAEEWRAEQQRRLLAEQRAIIDAVKAELTKDSGNSVKDKTNQSAQETRESLEILKEIREYMGQVAEIKETVGELTSDVKAIVSRQDRLENEIARLVLHEANSDLHKSRLREEMARKLGPPDAPPVDEGPQAKPE